jgi:hypothetical protein
LSDDKSEYVDGKLRQIVEKIESQARIFGLNKLSIDTNCTTYLMMTENEIIKLTPEELALGEIRLSNYSLCIQQHSNKAVAIKNWADRTIRVLATKFYNSFDKFMPYDIRRDCITSSDEYGQRLMEIVNEQQVVIDEFAYLSQAVQHVSESFGKFAKIRRKE